MLSPSEPEEFRSSVNDLIQSRRYLTGQDDFPDDRIPS
jgi:hypothetical protein